MSRPLCSVCCEANWSLEVNILGDITEMGWVSHNWRHTLENLRWYIANWTFSCKLKMVYWKLKTIADELFNYNNFNICSWSWNYHGCWHEIYPHINRSTWTKGWPNVNLTWCSTALDHLMPVLGIGVRGIGGDGVGEYIWPNISLAHSLTKCHADLQEYHSWTLDACTWGGVYSWKLPRWSIEHCRQ